MPFRRGVRLPSQAHPGLFRQFLYGILGSSLRIHRRLLACWLRGWGHPPGETPTRRRVSLPAPFGRTNLRPEVVNAVPPPPLYLGLLCEFSHNSHKLLALAPPPAKNGLGKNGLGKLDNPKSVEAKKLAFVRWALKKRAEPVAQPATSLRERWAGFVSFG
jgi:hypothetical protein